MKTKIRLIKPKFYQQPIINALLDKKHKFVSACLSRRIGKSVVAKAMAINWALTEKCKIGYITPSSDLSRKFIKEIVSNLEGSGAIKSSNSIDKFIEFSNGSIMYFISSESKDNARGNGFRYLIYDEAAFIDNETHEKVFKAMEMQARKVFLISTPNGSSGFFYDYYNIGINGTNDRYISFVTTLEESMLYDKETVDNIKDTTSRIVYEQEYNCRFISGGISAFGDVTKFLSPVKFKEDNEKVYAGIDFSGSGSDESVLTIVNSSCETILQKTYKIGNLESISDMADILNRYKVSACFAESNSMGAISIEHLKKSYRNVYAITTTNESKREYVENVILNFQKGIGSIPDDNETVQQFNNFVLKYTASKKITYGNISDSVHDDRVIAYCLACFCVKKKGRKGCYAIS